MPYRRLLNRRRVRTRNTRRKLIGGGGCGGRPSQAPSRKRGGGSCGKSEINRKRGGGGGCGRPSQAPSRKRGGGGCGSHPRPTRKSRKSRK